MVDTGDLPGHSTLTLVGTGEMSEDCSLVCTCGSSLGWFPRGVISAAHAAAFFSNSEIGGSGRLILVAGYVPLQIRLACHVTVAHHEVVVVKKKALCSLTPSPGNRPVKGSQRLDG